MDEFIQIRLYLKAIKMWRIGFYGKEQHLCGRRRIVSKGTKEEWPEEKKEVNNVGGETSEVESAQKVSTVSVWSGTEYMRWSSQQRRQRQLWQDWFQQNGMLSQSINQRSKGSVNGREQTWAKQDGRAVLTCWKGSIVKGKRSCFRRDMV